jgi:phosphatidylglycerophosphate synthase
MPQVEQQPVFSMQARGADPNDHPGAAEEFLDALIHRRVAGVLVRAVYATPITAMHITFLAALAGVVAGYCFAEATRQSLLLGALFLLASHILDCADGQLARARGQSSTIGRIADGLSDYVVGVAVHVGMLLFLSKHLYSAGNIELSQIAKLSLVAFAGASMTAHCLLFDFYKHRYLSPTHEAPAPTPVEAAPGEAASGATARGSLMGMYAFYVRVQSSLVPKAEEHSAPMSAARIRLWGAIGPANHHALLVLTFLGAAFTNTAPFYYVFFVGIIMNVYMGALLLFTSDS